MEIIIINGHVSVQSADNNLVNLSKLVFNACEDYDGMNLEFLKLSLLKALTHVEEQILLQRIEANPPMSSNS